MALRDTARNRSPRSSQPAIELADGFPLDEMRAYSLDQRNQVSSSRGRPRSAFSCRTAALGSPARSSASRTWRARCAPWRRPKRRRWPAGAARAKAIDAVRDYFYRGDIAHKIDEFMKANGGLLRYEDMAAFHLQPEEPVSTTFHGYTVYKPGFWTQGPTMIEALNILDGVDLPAAEAQFRQLYPHAGRGAEAGLCRPRHVLRRPQVREDSGRAAALEGVRGRAAQADHERRPRSNSARATSRRIRRKHPFYCAHRALQDRRRAAGARTPRAWTPSTRTASPSRSRRRARGCLR